MGGKKPCVFILLAQLRRSHVDKWRLGVCVSEGMDVTKRWEGRVAKGWLSDDKHGQGKEWY